MAMGGVESLLEQELVSGVINGDLVLVRNTLARGGDPRVSGQRCLVSDTARRGHHHLLSCLLEAGLSLEGSGFYDETPLMLAAREGHKGTVEALLELGANPQTRDSNGATALHHAAERGHVECVERLVGVTGRPPCGEEATTPLHLACGGGHLSVVKVLVDADWPLRTRNKFGQTALHCAAQCGNVEVLQHMVKAGLDPHVQDSLGQTALHFAAWGCSVELFQHLADAGLDTHVKDYRGRTPLDVGLVTGVMNGDLVLVKEALARGGDPQVGGWRCLMTEAVGYDHHQLLSCLLEAGLSPEGSGAHSWTPLMLAAREGHNSSVEKLLELGANPQTRDSDGRTALHYAAKGGHEDCVKILVKVTQRPSFGEATTTPLHLACHDGHLLVVKVLQAAGWPLHIKDPDGQTAFHWAARGGSVEVLQHLVKAGVDTNEQDSAGQTAVHCSARGGSVDVVKYLLEVGLDRQVQDNNGQTALHCAARSGSVEVVKHLLEAGLDRNVQDCDGQTALHCAARGDSVEVFQHLVEADLDPDVKDHRGRTPLEVATEYGLAAVLGTSVAEEHVRMWSDATSVNVMLYLDKVRQQRERDGECHRHIVGDMEAGYYEPDLLDNIPIHAADGDGLTLLHHAAKCRDAAPVFKALIKRGANPHVMTPEGTTPADLARLEGHTEVLEALSRHICCKSDTPRDELYHQLLSTIGLKDDVGKVSSLLCQGAPLQPLGSGSYYDVECGSVQALRLAVLSCRRGIVSLLLVSGAKLPASLLQEAWQSRDVNEEVLADLTTAYCCFFRAERRRAEQSTELVQAIDDLLKAIEGDAPWDATWPNKSPQRLSCLQGKAARSNCPLTVGFLSQAGAWPFLSGEWGASALHAALEAGKNSLAEMLVRDLGGCLYTPDAARRLPRDLLPDGERRRLEELQFLKERSKLEDLDILQVVGHRQLTARQALTVQKELYECYVAGRPHEDLSPAGHRIALLLAARRGLPQLMFLVLQMSRFSSGRVVVHECGTTALHEAASRGKGACVALLLCHGAERQSRDKYDQTPSLLAAMFGHRNMRHLLEQGTLQDNLPCRAGTTPEQVSLNFDAYLRTYEKCGIKVRQSLTLVDRRHPDAFTRKLLHGITLTQLQKEAERARVDFSRGEAREVKGVVMAELRAIMDKVERTDPMYRGELFLAGSSRDGSKLYAPDEFDVNVVIEVDNVIVSVEETERLLAPRKGRKKLSVSGDNPGLKENKFVIKFFSLVQETLAEHQLQDERLSLVPPGITSTQVGVALALAWQGWEYPLLLVAIDLVPVVKVPWHQEVARPLLTPVDAPLVMNLSNTAGGSWRCSFAQVEAAVLQQLSPAERLPYLMGKVLLCCHKAEPWMPRLSSGTRNTWLASGHWKSRVPNGFSYKNAFLRWLEQRRREDAGLEEDPAKVLLDIFREMCINPEAAPQDRQESSSPAYFGGDCEAPKSGKGALLIMQWLEGELEKGKRRDSETPMLGKETPITVQRPEEASGEDREAA